MGIIKNFVVCSLLGSKQLFFTCDGKLFFFVKVATSLDFFGLVPIISEICLKME